MDPDHHVRRRRIIAFPNIRVKGMLLKHELSFDKFVITQYHLQTSSLRETYKIIFIKMLQRRENVGCFRLKTHRSRKVIQRKSSKIPRPTRGRINLTSATFDLPWQLTRTLNYTKPRSL